MSVSCQMSHSILCVPYICCSVSFYCFLFLAGLFHLRFSLSLVYSTIMASRAFGSSITGVPRVWHGEFCFGVIVALCSSCSWVLATVSPYVSRLTQLFAYRLNQHTYGNNFRFLCVSFDTFLSPCKSYQTKHFRLLRFR
jgi:hypothetical protein